MTKEQAYAEIARLMNKGWAMGLKTTENWDVGVYYQETDEGRREYIERRRKEVGE